MTGPWRALLVLLFLPLIACRRPVQGESEAREAVVEIRDARGYVTFTLRTTEAGFVFVDHVTRQEGRIVSEAGGILRSTGDGRAVVEARPLLGGGLELRRAEGLSLRLSKEGTGFRLADGHEIPRGRLRPEGTLVFAHDAGGAVTAQARAEGGRIAILDRNGAALGFVTGKVSTAKAATVYLPALDAAERALLLAATW